MSFIQPSETLQVEFIRYMVVKISIWIIQFYDFTIPSIQNDPDLSRIFAIVQDW